MSIQNQQARSIVLRELFLLRALAASLRTSSFHPDALRRSSLPLKPLPPPDHAIASLAHPEERIALAAEEGS
jgi:hypothetical protein